MDDNQLMDWKLMRIKKKIKLNEMNDFVGCTYNMLSLFENGHSNMSEDKIIKYKEFIESK